MERQRHFVLVHGACHGAWCWYKVATLLKSAGHRVTALDMAASGVHPKRVDELQSISDYFEPLMKFMASLVPEERVILVGHSRGGLSISVAMERFPEKISSAVFAAAIMPGPDFSFTSASEEIFYACYIGYPYDGSFFYTSQQIRLAKLSGLEMDLKLDLFFFSTLLGNSKKVGVTKEKYGSIPRAYIVCDEDVIIKEALQRWMIENNPPDEVMVVPGSDHMLMFSRPQETCSCLLEIAKKYF
ncbi:unnamed protein product [Dovyalis caffra]|uniref:AB hydrolase-1 domain-containing protein n=1 Tax=Dovyalis caffra TaxID=77055 RepID=A0AAV1RRY1_9ROSI|nr:unnamed protein product [Dovyalis caffra]